MKPTEDRRVVRTRDALQEAAIELILERGYDAMTVNDIIARANVARSTFYAHHTGKESVLLASVSSLREYLLRAQRERQAEAKDRTEPLVFSLAMFEHADEHRDLYQALLGDRGGTAVLGAIRQMLARLIQRELDEVSARSSRRDAVPVAATIRFASDGFLSVLTWWIEAKPRLTPAEGDRIFRRLVEPALVASGCLQL